MTEITVLGRKIRVKFVTAKEISVRSGDRKDLGFFVGHENTIYIAKTLDEEARRRVLLHELFHAALYVGGIHNILNERAEESVCDVAENFLELFRNKDFVTYLGGKQ